MDLDWRMHFADGASSASLHSVEAWAANGGLAQWRVDIAGTDIDAMTSMLATYQGRVFARGLEGIGRTTSGGEVRLSRLAAVRGRHDWRFIALQHPEAPRQTWHVLGKMSLLQADCARLLVQHRRAGTNDPVLLRRLWDARLGADDYAELLRTQGEHADDAVDSLIALRRGSPDRLSLSPR